MHNSGMRTHAEIIQAAGVTAVSKLTDKPISTVSSWGQRNSIPSEHWAALIGAGTCTADELIDAAASRRAAA